MKSIQLRNIDDVLLEALKQMAKKHHRSLQGELHVIIEAAALQETGADAGELKLVTVNTGRAAAFSREDIYDDDGR